MGSVDLKNVVSTLATYDMTMAWRMAAGQLVAVVDTSGIYL